MSERILKAAQRVRNAYRPIRSQGMAGEIWSAISDLCDAVDAEEGLVAPAEKSTERSNPDANARRTLWVLIGGVAIAMSVLAWLTLLRG